MLMAHWSNSSGDLGVSPNSRSHSKIRATEGEEKQKWAWVV